MRLRTDGHTEPWATPVAGWGACCNTLIRRASLNRKRSCLLALPHYNSVIAKKRKRPRLTKLPRPVALSAENCIEATKRVDHENFRLQLIKNCKASTLHGGDVGHCPESDLGLISRLSYLQIRVKQALMHLS